MEGSFILKEIHTLGPNIVTAGDSEQIMTFMIFQKDLFKGLNNIPGDIIIILC